MGQAQLPGVVDAVEFRDAVLAQRDLVTDHSPRPAESSAPAVAAEASTLNEIRDCLHRIEGRLAERWGREG
jgi:hypothetical protein